MSAVGKLLWVSAQRLIRGRIGLLLALSGGLGIASFSTMLDPIAMLDPSAPWLSRMPGRLVHGIAFGLLFVYWGSLLLTAMRIASPDRVRLMPKLRSNLLLALCLVQSILVLCALGAPLMTRTPFVSLLLILYLQLLVGWTLAAPVWGSWLGLLSIVFFQVDNWPLPAGGAANSASMLASLLLLAAALFVSMWIWIGNGSASHRKRYQSKVNGWSAWSRGDAQWIFNRDSGRWLARVIAQALSRRLPPNANGKALLAYGVLPRWTVRQTLATSLALLGGILAYQTRLNSDPVLLEAGLFLVLFPAMNVVNNLRYSLHRTRGEQALIRLGAKVPVASAINPAILANLLLPAVATQLTTLTVYATALLVAGEDLARLTRVLVLLISASAWQPLFLVRPYASMKPVTDLLSIGAVGLYLIPAAALIFGRQHLMLDVTMILAGLNLVVALAVTAWAVRRAVRGPVFLPVGRLA